MKTEFRLNLKIECTYDIHKFWSHAEKHFHDGRPYQQSLDLLWFLYEWDLRHEKV